MEITVHQGDEAVTQRIATFYRTVGSSAQVQLNDITVIAEHEGKIVGVVRLCTEYDVLVMRGMIVHPDSQKRGIGKQMLSVVQHRIQNIDCFCIPHTYLQDFYGQIGFRPVEEQQAPPHLQQRLHEYRESDLQALIMKRR